MYLLISGLPLALYLLMLALINRRSRAMMISGPWDFLGVIFAVSGFLGLFGPVLLTSIDERMRRFWIVGQRDGPLISPEHQSTLSILLFVLYFVLVLGGISFLLWKRRSVTAVYNVDHDVFGAVLGKVLTHKQIQYQQVANCLFLKAPQQEGNLLAAERCSVEVDPSKRFCHVTLQWEPAKSLLRQEIEKELEEELEKVPAPDNPAGDWLLVISGILFLAWLLGLAVWTLYQIFGQR